VFRVDRGGALKEGEIYLDRGRDSPWRKCSVRETGILVQQQSPQGVLVCDHAGLVINKFSLELV